MFGLGFSIIFHTYFSGTFHIYVSDMAVIPPDRIMLWTLEGEGADPEYFGKVDIGGASNLQALWVALETNDALECRR